MLLSLHVPEHANTHQSTLKGENIFLYLKAVYPKNSKICGLNKWKHKLTSNENMHPKQV